MRTQKIISLIWLISVQLICTGAIYAEVNPEDTTILLKAFRKVTSQGQIVYIDTVNASGSIPNQLKEIIQKSKITDKRQGETITLSKSEQEYLLSQLAKPTVWDDNLFSDCKRIDADSMWTHIKLKDIKRRIALNQAVLQKDTTTIKNLQHSFSYVFSFSKPIYIRDNTICLISFSAICGGTCGQSEASFYKKSNNQWSKWIIVTAGDF